MITRKKAWRGSSYLTDARQTQPKYVRNNHHRDSARQTQSPRVSLDIDEPRYRGEVFSPPPRYRMQHTKISNPPKHTINWNPPKPRANKSPPSPPFQAACTQLRMLSQAKIRDCTTCPIHPTSAFTSLPFASDHLTSAQSSPVRSSSLHLTPTAVRDPVWEQPRDLQP